MLKLHTQFVNRCIKGGGGGCQCKNTRVKGRRDSMGVPAFLRNGDSSANVEVESRSVKIYRVCFIKMASDFCQVLCIGDDKT